MPRVVSRLAGIDAGRVQPLHSLVPDFLISHTTLLPINNESVRIHSQCLSHASRVGISGRSFLVCTLRVFGLGRIYIFQCFVRLKCMHDISNGMLPLIRCV